MPVTLPPLSRRDLLRAGSAAALGLAVPLTGCRSPRDASPTATPAPAWTPAPHADRRIVLLSDTHINGDPTTRDHHDANNMSDNLAAVVRHLLDPALGPTPDWVLINGDCTHDIGTPADYAQLLTLLRPLREAGTTLRFTLGNHDDRTNFAAAFADVHPGETVAFDRHVDTFIESGVRVILLDSLMEVDVTPGDLGADQIAWLADMLADDSRPAVIFLHPPPYEFDRRGKDWCLLDSSALAEAVAPHAGRVAFVHGHAHRLRGDRWPDLGIPVLGLPAIGYAFGRKAVTLPGAVARVLSGVHPLEPTAWRPGADPAPLDLGFLDLRLDGDRLTPIDWHLDGGRLFRGRSAPPSIQGWMNSLPTPA